jgi:hypothetical protein
MRIAGVLAATVVAGLLAGGALAGTASAAAPCAVPPPQADYSYQAGLTPLLPAGEAAARQATGAQYTLLWLDPVRKGWHIAIAPGPLDAVAARAAIVAALQGALPAADASYLADRLEVGDEPYSEAELNATRDGIVAALSSAPRSFGWSLGWGACTLSDNVRVEMTLFNDSTPADADTVRALLAPYGDKVRLAISASGPPVAVAGLPAPYPVPIAQKALAFARYVTLPASRRCVRGTVAHVALLPATRKAVRSVSVTVAGRRQTLAAKRLATPLAVRLTSRRTTIAVAVTLVDGRSARRTVTLTRCRA